MIKYNICCSWFLGEDKAEYIRNRTGRFNSGAAPGLLCVQIYHRSSVKINIYYRTLAATVWSMLNFALFIYYEQSQHSPTDWKQGVLVFFFFTTLTVNNPTLVFSVHLARAAHTDASRGTLVKTSCRSESS